MLVGPKPKPAGQAHEKMTQRTAEGLDSVIEGHHIPRSEILWIHVDDEDGAKDGVQLLRSSFSLRPPIC